MYFFLLLIEREWFSGTGEWNFDKPKHKRYRQPLTSVGSFMMGCHRSIDLAV